MVREQGGVLGYVRIVGVGRERRGTVRLINHPPSTHTGLLAKEEAAKKDDNKKRSSAEQDEATSSHKKRKA